MGLEAGGGTEPSLGSSMGLWLGSGEELEMCSVVESGQCSSTEEGTHSIEGLHSDSNTELGDCH